MRIDEALHHLPISFSFPYVFRYETPYADTCEDGHGHHLSLLSLCVHGQAHGWHSEGIGQGP